MKTRLLVGIPLIGLLVLLTWLDSLWSEGYIYIVLATLLTIFALREYYHMAERAGGRVPAWMGIAAGVIIVVGQWLMGLEFEWAQQLKQVAFTRPGSVVGVLTVSCLALLAVRAWSGHVQGAILSIGALVMGLIYVPVLVTFMTAIHRNWSIWTLVAFVATCKSGDMAAYFVGSRWGRWSLAPRVSPKKTIEGAVAAVIMSLLVALLCRRLGALQLGIGFAVVFGVMLGVSSVVGDLAESVLKRDSQIKDSASFLPGFGGVLDLLDDVLFAAPIAYYFLRVTIKI